MAKAKISNPANKQISDSTGRVQLQYDAFFTLIANFASGEVTCGSYALANLPSASANPGAIIYVSNATGGPCLAVSNGTAWKKVALGATVS